MGLVTRTYNFVNGTIADADEVDTDLNALYTTINGNLDNDNIKPAAGIDGSKLASGSVGTAQLVNDSVDNNKLKDDASVDANRAVTRDHIRDAAINTAKVQASSLGLGSLLITEVTVNVPFPVNGTDDVTVDTGIARANYLPLGFYQTSTAMVPPQGFIATIIDDGTTNYKIFVERDLALSGGNPNPTMVYKIVFLKKVGI